MNVLVGAWIGSTNLGDELTTSAMVRKLRARGVEIQAISINPANTLATHGIEPVGHTDLPGLNRAFRRADRLVFGGGGLLQNETSPWNLPYHLSRVWQARFFRLPFGAIGLGATGLSSAGGRRLVRWSIKGQRSFSVRDAESARVLRAMGVNDVLLSADLALDQQVTVAEPKDRLVVCLRHSLMSRRPLPDHMRLPRLDDEWIDRMAEALDDACLATGLVPHFVAFQIDRDHDVHTAVAARMTTGATFATPTLETVLREVQSGVAVIAMRYHAVICAILSGRPSVLIAYAGKMDALATEVGPVVRNEPAAFSGIAGLLVAAISSGERTLEVRAHLQEREHNNDMALDRLLEQP